MESWLEHTFLPGAITAAVLLLVLWPTTHSGKRLLERWGIPDPRPDQIGEAVRYLWWRRILYVVLLLVAPSLLRGVFGDNPSGIVLVVPLLVAMLIAELVAALRPVGGVRVASLGRRGWRDLVPGWAVWTGVVGVVVTVALAVLGLVADPHKEHASASPWQALAYVAGTLLLVGALVALAVRRPAVSDETVDAALRTRSARVAVGIGFGMLGTAMSIASDYLKAVHEIGDGARPAEPPDWLTDDFVDAIGLTGLVAVILAVVCWMWVAMPSRKSLARR